MSVVRPLKDVRRGIFIVAAALILAPPLLACPSDVASLMSPVGGIEAPSTLVSFAWTEIAEASSYHVWVVSEGDSTPRIAGNTILRPQLQAILPRGSSYEWWVETRYRNCPSTFSARALFSLPELGTCAPEPLPLDRPLTDSVLEPGFVHFSWSSLTGAVSYRLLVQQRGGIPEVLATTSEAVTRATVVLTSGDYDWWVEATTETCPSVISEKRSLQISLPDEACRGEAELVLLAPAEGQTELSSPVIMTWTDVPGATSYRIYGVTPEGDVIPMTEISETTFAAAIPPGSDRWYVEAIRPGCPSLVSTIDWFAVRRDPPCGPPLAPELSTPKLVTPGTSYRVTWLQVIGAASYELEASDRSDFEGASSTTLTTTSVLFGSAENEQTWYYRVRGVADCDGSKGEFSVPASVTVAASGGNRDAPISIQTDAHARSSPLQRFEVRLEHPFESPREARLTSDQPWLRVIPETLVLEPGGNTIELEVKTGSLPIGSSTATIRIEPLGQKKGSSTTTTSVGVSVGLVTPVQSSPTSTPVADSLLIPGVARASGIASEWLSDVALVSAGAGQQKFELIFTETGVTQTPVRTTIQASGGTMVEIGDILSGLFAAEQRSRLGVLEIRPLKSSADASIAGTSISSAFLQRPSTFATSRTYTSSATGTLGQYIPAFRLSELAGTTDTTDGHLLYLAGITQDADFRTNFGFLEGTGAAVRFDLTVFDATGIELLRLPVELDAHEHRQINQLLSLHDLTVTNGYAVVENISGSGKVAVYASVVDNRTNDPQLIRGQSSSPPPGGRWILPGIASMDAGEASWSSGMNVLNPTDDSVETTLTFFAQGSSDEPLETTRTIPPRSVLRFDNLLREGFGVDNSGGAVHFRAEPEARLVVNARTRHVGSDGGTVGQFIPSMSIREGTARGFPPLQLLQVEESTLFRTNLGIAEVTGEPVVLEVRAFPAGGKTSAAAIIRMKGFEFVQIPSVLGKLGLPTTYNARLAISVIEGDGAIVSYASVIDNRTNDPMFLPGQ
ncbi:MAG: hypothetical protein KY432_04400 [Acidobacteria bacterium]|nr:hypothetical protein [Acidobacteriota bacterium]